MKIIHSEQLLANTGMHIVLSPGQVFRSIGTLRHHYIDSLMHSQYAAIIDNDDRKPPF